MGSTTQLRYHLILTTKYRYPSLLGIENTVYDALHDVALHSDFKILDMGIEHGNHIHIVLKASPRYSVSSIVSRIKGYTLKYVWDREYDHLTNFYWGSRKKLWHGAYYCSTVGDVSLGKVLDYVKNQDGVNPND